MVKRIILISLVVFAAVFMTGGYFYLKSTMVEGTDPLAAVAGDAAVIVRAESVTGFLSAIKSGSELWSGIGTVLNSDRMMPGVSFLDSLFKSDTRAGGMVEGKSLCFSLHPSGRDSYDVVFYIKLPVARERKAAGELMHQLLSGHATVSERAFNRVEIYDAAFRRDHEGKNLSWTVSRGIFILSFSPILMENAVNQLMTGTSLLEDPDFHKVFVTGGSNVEANVFVSLERLPGFFSTFTEGEGKKFLSDFADLGKWAELDMHTRDDVLLLNGFSWAGGSENNYLNVFNGQSPVNIGAESVIPGYSSAFLALGLSDIPLFYDNYLEWLTNTGRLEHHRQMSDDFERLTGADPASAFWPFVDGEAALVMAGWEVPGERGKSYLLMKTRSRSMAAEALSAMISHHAGLTGRKQDEYRHVYQVDRETSFDIYHFPFDDTGELLFGKLFGAAQTSYYCFVDNYLVFGESVGALSEFLRASVLNQTLSVDARFNDVSEYLVANNNLFFYSRVNRSAAMFTELFRESLSESIVDNFQSFRKFQALSVQFTSGRDMIYNNIFLKFSPQVIEEPHTEWQTLLDTIIDFKPLLLLNHNTGENEIFVQDINNTIYLINNAGRILWKKPLPARIMGNVFQIDYFGNNRLQMLFNTRDQIFLLDRNGNDVGRYPVSLPSPATNGISVFDYDNNKDYRIFVACEDMSVVVRSKDGNIISGWTFPGSEHNVFHEISFFREGGRDYIVFADRHRVYILDRRGNTRVSPDSVFPVSSNAKIAFEGRTPSTEARLTLTDTLGTVWHIYLDGKTESVRLKNYSGNHYFDLQDVDANGYRDYIFVDDNRLDVFRRDGSLMFSHEFAVNIDHAPAYYHFSRQDRKLGVVSGESGRIFLIDSSGEVYNGFPLAGRSYFTIGLLQPGRGNFQLIVGSNNNFLYNYSVY